MPALTRRGAGWSTLLPAVRYDHQAKLTAWSHIAAPRIQKITN
jgi:hypothetical protein